MKHSLDDLNDYLFLQMDALSNDDLTGAELKEQVVRSKAMTEVADKIIRSSALKLKSRELIAIHGEDAFDGEAREAVCG